MVTLFFYYTFMQGLLIALAFLFWQKEKPVLVFPAANDIKAVAKFSTVTFIGSVFFFLTCRLDIYFVEKYCSNVALGNYIQVSRLGQMLLFVPQVLATVIFPQSAKVGNDKKEIAAHVLSLGRLIVLAYIILFFGLLVLGNWFFPFVFGASYSLMNIIFLLFVPGFCALSCLALISAWFLGNGFLKINVTGALLALITLVAADIFFVPSYGVYAAAIVSSVAYIVNVLYASIMLSKKMKIPFAEFFSFGKKDFYWIKNIIKV
jgi:O-antigen/teichoic acid export membrane protein